MVVVVVVTAMIMKVRWLLTRTLVLRKVIERRMPSWFQAGAGGSKARRAPVYVCNSWEGCGRE
jgi:hypothetical protein